METVLRDAQQSLIATRMPYEDFKDILGKIDDAGFAALECWGGATFDTCLRFLNEDPWERLKLIKKYVKKTPLQMLFRGQNILGYKHYPDDVVRLFVDKAAECGMDIFRIFDALNDFRNIRVAVEEVIKIKKHAQGCICYTTSPIHNLDMYAKMGKELENMGVHSICIKDMAGIMGPNEAYELIKKLKETVKVPIHLHTHSTTGFGPITYLKAVEAGVDCIDTAISSMSGGTSQPATETMYFALQQLGYESDLKPIVLKEINDFFKPMRDKYIKSGLLSPLVMGTEADALVYQVPGGMLSNLISQLTEQKALDKLNAVLEETPKVRKDLGYPPLVTPMSQMVGVQAVYNVLLGERYKNVSKEIKSYLAGEYGTAPGVVDKDLVHKVLGDIKPYTGRFADTLNPIFKQVKEETKDFAFSDTDVLSYIAFPQIAEKFLKDRNAKLAKQFTYSIRKVEE